MRKPWAALALNPAFRYTSTMSHLPERPMIETHLGTFPNHAAARRVQLHWRGRAGKRISWRVRQHFANALPVAATCLIPQAVGCLVRLQPYVRSRSLRVESILHLRRKVSRFPFAYYNRDRTVSLTRFLLRQDLLLKKGITAHNLNVNEPTRLKGHGGCCRAKSQNRQASLDNPPRPVQRPVF